MIKDLKKAKERVGHILKEYPTSRDSDKVLWLAYLVMFHDLRSKLGPTAYADFKEILLNDDTCTMESIRRIRQKFQEAGEYVGKKRKFKMEEEKLVREMMRDS